jgi:4-amino-4-deoxy-L-arabinose transferase-like glycosyltransferase
MAKKKKRTSGTTGPGAAPSSKAGAGSGAVEAGARMSPGRRHLLLLAAVLLVALLLRLLALASLSGTVYFDTPLLDEQYYHDWAVKLAAGTWESSSVYRFAPLPAYLMAAVYRVLSPDILYIRLLNIGLGVLSCFFIARIGRELAGRKAGLLAGLLAAVYMPFIFYSIVPLKASLAVCLFAAVAWLLLALLVDESPAEGVARAAEQAGEISAPEKMVAARTHGTWRSLAMPLLLGLAAGLLMNVQATAVAVIPVIFGILLYVLLRDLEARRRTVTLLALCAAGLVLATAPFAVRNHRASGEFVLTTAQSGFALYMGNRLENPDPYFRPVPFAFSAPSEQLVQMTVEASRRAGRKLTANEASAFWRSEVLHQAETHPADMAGKIGRKILVLFNRFEAGDHYDIDFMSRFAGFFRIPLPAFWMVMPFGMAGLLTTFWRSRQGFAAAALAASYAATLVLFYTSARFRLPLLAVLIPFAAIGLLDAIALFKKKDLWRLAVRGAIVAAFAVLAFLPVRGTGDETAYYNTHAILLDRKGLRREAIYWWQLSSTMKGAFSGFANVSLAVRRFAAGDVQGTQVLLEEIPEDSLAAAAKYELLGDLKAREGKDAEAAALYRKSLEVNSGERRTRAKLIRLYERLDPAKAREERHMLDFISSFYGKP